MNQIAIIDDDELTLSLLETHLKIENYSTRCFKSAKEFLDIFESWVKSGEFYQAPFDLILSDVRMPDMDGLTFLKKSREIRPDVPVILMTAFAQFSDAVKAIKEGAYDYLPKTFDPPDHFKIIIEQALRYRRLQNENTCLKLTLHSQWKRNGIIGKSQAITQVFDLIERISPTNANVLITGESGTGKELVARAIHHQGPRSKGPFMAINCSAIPANLLESELFGHAKGSFTGAVADKVGLFEQANGGTLFLDEIGDMPMDLQAKLLRVLQERKVRPVGKNIQRSIDVRIISATHKDLQKAMSEGKFREDLYYRLNVIPIEIPPLRKRREDIPILANYFLNKYTAIHNGIPKAISEGALKKLYELQFKGNVRELENLIERLVVLCQGHTISEEDIPDSFLNNVKDETEEQIIHGTPTLKDMEKKYIQYILQRTNNVKDTAAQLLGISRRTLYRKLEELNMERL